MKLVICSSNKISDKMKTQVIVDTLNYQKISSRRYGVSDWGKSAFAWGATVRQLGRIALSVPRKSYKGVLNWGELSFSDGYGVSNW